MTEIAHWRPDSLAAAGEVEVSIVIPTLNERVTVGEFVDRCWQGLAKAGVTGQVLLVDSSTDDTPQIALAHGAEVLRVPQRGLGRAYVDAMPYVRGRLVLMGDADLTYDFQEIAPFVEAWRRGAEFIMGSRLKGTIQQGSMPPLHRYFGTPLTTWILNRIYGSRFSDIHCGMRALTRAALVRMDIQSQSWEYASEMVLKAARLRLRTSEVPIHFHKDREGRVSHHRRLGWFSPWMAGWINLKVMLVYAADKFLVPPGLALFALGLPVCLALRTGPRELLGIGFQLHWLLLGITCCLTGFGLIQIGVLSRFVQGIEGERPSRILKAITYNRGIVASLVLGAAGLGQLGRFAIQYVKSSLLLREISYPSLFALFLLTLAFQCFAFTLTLEICRRRFPRKGAGEDT
jgi:hypothetical protein